MDFVPGAQDDLSAIDRFRDSQGITFCVPLMLDESPHADSVSALASFLSSLRFCSLSSIPPPTTHLLWSLLYWPLSSVIFISGDLTLMGNSAVSIADSETLQKIAANCFLITMQQINKQNKVNAHKCWLLNMHPKNYSYLN